VSYSGDTAPVIAAADRKRKPPRPLDTTVRWRFFCRTITTGSELPGG